MMGWKRTAADCLVGRLVTASPKVSENLRIQGVRKSFLPHMCVSACSAPAALIVVCVQWEARLSVAPRQARGNLYHCGQHEMQVKTCLRVKSQLPAQASEQPPHLIALDPRVQASGLFPACIGVSASLSSWQPGGQQGRVMPQQCGTVQQPEGCSMMQCLTPWKRLPSPRASPSACGPHFCGILKARGSLDSGQHGGC